MESRANCVSQKVVIIGAGLSGLSAASKLIENGFENVVVLEAENRIGGRVWSSSFAMGAVDLGAQFVHGEKGNAIYELVHPHSELKVLPHPKNDYDYLQSNGQPANRETCYEVDEVLSGWLRDLPETRNESVGSLVERQCRYEDLQRFDQTLITQMVALHEKQCNVSFASESWRDVSTFSKRYSVQCEGNQMIFWRSGQFRKVFDYILKKLPKSSKRFEVDSKIQLKKKVWNINWEEAGKIVVTCADGSTYIADHVIVTASLGVLKSHHMTLFQPKLPEVKVRAIDALGFGAIGKIYLEFVDPFWPKDEKWFGYFCLWTEEDCKSITGTDREWLLSIMVVIRVVGNPNVLQAFICPKGLKLFESLESEKLIDDFMWALERFVGKPLSRPVDMKRTKWLTNENFLGTSSFYSMESERQGVTPKDLAESICDENDKPIILFAGEATHEKFSGCSHGAVESGWRAAKEIMEFWAADGGIQSCSD